MSGNIPLFQKGERTIAEDSNKRKLHPGQMIRFILIAVLLCIISFSLRIIFDTWEDMKASDKETALIYDRVAETAVEDEGFTRESFLTLRQENPDLIAWLESDSGSVRLPVVQHPVHDYYLRRSFYGSYSEQGTPFMDENSVPEDTNILIYGHNVYYDENAQFSPVARMTDQEEYEKNRYFSLYLEDEVRRYAVTHVYYLTAEEYEDYDFQRPDFDSEKEWNEWIALPDSHNLIQSDDCLRYGNRFITLQTCKKWDDDVRIIVLAKEIASAPFPS